MISLLVPDVQELEAVEKGANFLDEVWVGDEPWWANISASALNLVDGEDCIIGQLFGEYHAGCEALEIYDVTSYGFDPNFGMRPSVLEGLWVSAINQRRRLQGDVDVHGDDDN